MKTRKRNGQFKKGHAKVRRSTRARAASPSAAAPRKRRTTRAAPRKRRAPAAPRRRPRRARAAAPIIIAAAAPRRRPAKRGRRRAREMPGPFASLEAYRLGQKSAAKPRRRAKRASPAAPRRQRRRTTAPRRRGARRGYSRESLAAMEERICRNIERGRNGRFKRGGRKATRRGKATKKTTRRRRRISAHKRYNQKAGKIVRVKSYLRAGDMLSNPISGGEVGVLVGVTALGYILTDFMSRYLATEPSGYVGSGTTDVVIPNASSVIGMPSWLNIGAQTLLSVAGFVGGGMASKAGKKAGKGGGGLGSAALYGVGLGAGTHLLAQLFSGLMARWAGSKTSATGTTPAGTLARLYSAEIAAQNAQYTALNTATTATPPGAVYPGFAGPPEGQLGQHPVAGHPGLGQFWGQVQQVSPVPSTSAQVPSNYIYVAAANLAPTNLGNGTQQCPDGSVVAVGMPCNPPAYVVLGNGFIQPNGASIPAGATVTGYYFMPATPNNGYPPNPNPYIPPQAPPAYVPPAPLPTCMPQPSDGGGCGCMGFTPDTLFPD